MNSIQKISSKLTAFVWILFACPPLYTQTEEQTESIKRIEQNVSEIERFLREDITKNYESLSQKINEQAETSEIPETTKNQSSALLTVITILNMVLTAGLFIWIFLGSRKSKQEFGTIQSAVASSGKEQSSKLETLQQEQGNLGQIIGAVRENLEALNVDEVSEKTAASINQLDAFCTALESQSNEMTSLLENLSHLVSQSDALNKRADSLALREGAVEEKSKSVLSLEKFIDKLNDKATEIGGSLSELEAQEKKNTKILKRSKELESEAVLNLEEASRLESLLWPAQFAEEGNLASWKDTINGAITNELKGSRSLVGTLFYLNGLIETGEAELNSVALTIHQTSVCLYQLFEGLEMDSEQIFESSVQWKNAILEMLGGHSESIKITIISARDNYDMDSMETVQELSGSRLTIAEAKSWTIYSNVGGHKSLLHRGLVVTA